MWLGAAIRRWPDRCRGCWHHGPSGRGLSFRTTSGACAVSRLFAVAEVIGARLGFHCKVKGTSCAGAAGRITVAVCAVARDGISRIHAISLVGPAGSSQLGVGQVDAGRADARGLQGLPLAQRPGREQVRRRRPQHIVSQVRQRDRVLTGQAVAGPQPDQKRLRAEHLVGYPFADGNQAAGDGHRTGRSSGGPGRGRRAG